VEPVRCRVLVSLLEFSLKPLRSLLPILLAAVTLSPIDYERALIQRVEVVVARFHSPVRYRHLGNGWFEFTDTTMQRVFRKCFADAPELQGKKPKKIIVFDLAQVDTTGFSDRFVMTDRIPIGTGYNPCVGHIGRSGRRYIIGGQVLKGRYTSTFVYGFDSTRKRWHEIHEYKGFGFAPIGTISLSVTDTPQFAGDSSGSVIVFGTSPDSDIPDRRMLSFSGQSEFAQYPRQFDFDGDGQDEVVLRQWPPSFIIIDYADSSRMFSVVHRESYSNTVEYGMWAIGDFDRDGMGEYASSTRLGCVWVVEYDSVRGYSIVFRDTTRYQNIGYNCEGNDIDADGKSEFIIGSEVAFGQSNLAVYEYSVDNDYDVSCWLEFRGSGSLNNNITSGDITGDGRDELVYSRGGKVIVLTSDGDDSYRIFWTKQFQSEIFTRLFDLDNDGHAELLVGLNEDEAGFTEIYSLHGSISTADHNLGEPDSFAMSIYPTPAHDVVNIFLAPSIHARFNVTMYATNGYSTRTLISKEYFAGENILSFSTAHLPTGVYYIQISINDHSRIVKTVVIN
jgi:hypothetical protein